MAGDNLDGKSDSAKLILLLANLFAVSGFELHAFTEVWCHRHLTCRLVINVQPFVLFDFTSRYKSSNALALADFVFHANVTILRKSRISEFMRLASETRMVR